MKLPQFDQAVPSKEQPAAQSVGFTFHTLFKEEFHGISAEIVVDQLYLSSKAGMGNITFDEWWQFQSGLWKGKYGLSFPDRHETDACRKLLDIMVTIGALEQGPLPQKIKSGTDGMVPYV